MARIGLRRLIVLVSISILLITGCASRKPLVLNINNSNTFNINQARHIIEKSTKRNKINEKQAKKVQKEKIEMELKMAKQIKKNKTARVDQKKQVPCIGCGY
ncbi:MAG: hypothetical protein SNJ77_06470 [Cytophagales bacterium]